MSLHARLDPCPRCPPSHQPVKRGQRGSTLVEALIAIMIVSVLLLGVMAALSTSATVSRTTGQATRTRAALAAVTDRMATLSFSGCATVPTMIDAVTVPAGYTVTVTKVESLLPVAAACTAQSSVLKVTIKVAHPESKTSMEGEVVLRDRSAKPA